MNSLEFIPTGRLLAELQKRMDTMVFIGSAHRTDKEDAMFFGCCGPFHGCLGMIELGRMMVISQDGEDDDNPTR